MAIILVDLNPTSGIGAQKQLPFDELTGALAGGEAPITKFAWGATGALTLVETAAPLPVVQTGTHTVNLGAIGTAATQATAAATLALLPTALGVGGGLKVDLASRLDLQDAIRAFLQAHTSGGWTPHGRLSVGTAVANDAVSVKASAGQIGYLFVGNQNANARYLKLYNKASAPTVGTDTPVHTFIIPGAGSAGPGAGAALNIPAGIEFTTGIAYGLTTDEALADTGAVVAGEIQVNIGWK